MPGNDIKQKIVLEGEKEYNKALAEARRNLKTLKSELKAETAELGRNATEQQKNETRIKSLQKQIKEQEKIVKTYKDALDQVKEKYSDNEDAIAKWEQKLNGAREALANMRNELEGVGQGFKDVEGSADMAVVATRSVAETFERLSGIGGMISDGIESAFTGMLSIVKDSIGQIWSEILDIASKSDNYLDLASFLGASAEDVQKWDSAMKATGNDLSVVTSLISRLKYGGKAQKVTEWFGVSDVNYENDLEYFENVMKKMYELKGKMDDGTWDKAMSDIFGAKKVQDVDGVLSDWEDIVDGLNRFDPSKGGFGLTEKEMTDMATLSVQVKTLEESWQKLKEMGTVKLFGKLSMDLTSNAQGILDGFLAYFNAESDEEREEALKQVEDNILAMFERAKQAILDGIALLDQVAKDLKDSDNPTAQALGNILGGLVTALQWLTEDHMNEVVDALKILAAFWLTGKGLKMGMAIAEVAKNIAVIKAFSAGGAAAGAAGAATGGGGFLSGAASAIKAAAKTALPALLGIGLVVNDSLNNHGDENKWTEKETAAVLKKNTGFDSMDEWLWWNQLTSGLAKLEMTPEQWAAAQTFWDDQRKHDGEFTDEEWDAFEGAFAGQEELFDKINELMNYFIQSEHPDDWTSIEDLPSDWWKNPSSKEEVITNENIGKFNELPGNIEKAVAQSISGIRVYMNGQEVGNLVAPYVSAAIATQIG